MKNADICIYEHSSKKLKGSFFKEKPEVGDLIMSHNKRENNFLRAFEVVGIIENRNAIIQDDCKYDPTSAYFVLDIKDVTGDDRFAEIDNSINRLN